MWDLAGKAQRERDAKKDYAARLQSAEDALAMRSTQREHEVSTCLQLLHMLPSW